jgi:hypothetical protein
MFTLEVVEADALHRLAQLAVAAEAYRTKTGTLPERSDDLTPEYVVRIPADPFDGQPLRFKREGKDLIFYSVGEDGVDNGGVVRSGNANQGDIVFRLSGH